MVAWSLSVSQMPGTARSMAFLVVVSSQIISDFSQLSWSPSSPAARCTLSRSSKTSSRLPPRVLSSRKNTFSSLHNCCTISCMVRQKSNGPIGSPCCTPSDDHMMSFPKKREDGEPYAEVTSGSSSGTSFLTAMIILSRRRQLKAFLKSSFRMRWPGCKF